MQSSGFHALTLVDKTREYDEVFTFRFRPEVPFSFLPGQYVHLLAPQSPPGRENVRHLSIASLPSEEALRFTIDLASGSDYKRKLAALEPGGKAHLFKVKGDFVLGTPVPPRVVFLAGGLGMTPIRALIAQIVHEELPLDWRLGHVARGSFLYEKEVTAWGGLQRRVHREGLIPLLDDWVQEAADALWYVSGSHRFVLGVTGALAARDIPAERIRIEDFE